MQDSLWHPWGMSFASPTKPQKSHKPAIWAWGLQRGCPGTTANNPQVLEFQWQCHFTCLAWFSHPDLQTTSVILNLCIFWAPFSLPPSLDYCPSWELLVALTRKCPRSYEKGHCFTFPIHLVLGVRNPRGQRVVLLRVTSSFATNTSTNTPHPFITAENCERHQERAGW